MTTARFTSASLLLLLVAVMCAAATTTPTLKAATRSVIEVQFHLRSATHSEAAVEAAFVQRSTPGSALFRQHLTPAELAALVGASERSVNAAVRLLRDNGAGAVRVSSTRDVVSGLLRRETPAAQLAALGLTPLDFVINATSSFRRVLRPNGTGVADINAYSVLAVARAAVRPARPGKAKLGAAGNQFPGMTITPAEIFKRYKTPSRSVNAPAGFSQAVGEFEESRFRQSDVDTFTERYNLTSQVVNVVGPNVNGSSDNTEGTLDIEYMVAISGNIPTWWISQNMSNPNPGGIDFAWWCDEVLNVTPQPPSVVSLSWGLGDYNFASNPEALEADNRAFRKLGLVGVSVFAASGDSGPGARSYISCTSFMPGWPASSPYVTSVGATYANSARDSEEAVNFSGGGFSDYFPTPSWQADAVQNYLNNAADLPASSFYNASGRGYPDVSALGTNFMIYSPSAAGQPGAWGAVSGTSCASPTFASVISRINAERVGRGQPTLGFLNPTIYRLGRVGFDVTRGKSVETDCFGIITLPGFPAASGWDAVSGLGTPNYEYLSKAL